MRIAALTLLLLLNNPVVAEIYAFVDTNGVTHFSNVPSDERFELVLAESDVMTDSPLHPALRELSVRFDPLIRAAAEGVNLDPELLRAVVVVESGFDPDAVSSAGAQGLMQLMPNTADKYGVSDVFDPQENLQAGARYLRDLIDTYDQDYELALAAYNAGEPAIQKYGGRIPPYPETRKYVPSVIKLYRSLLELNDRG